MNKPEKLTSNYAQPKYDIQKAQIDSRVIHLEGKVDPALASYIIQTLFHLNELDRKSPIQMYINSPGGSVIDGMAIIDAMNFIEAPVYTIARGMAASMGALILAAGQKGKRFSLPNSVILIHEGSNGNEGTTSNFQSYAKFSEKLNIRANKFLAKATGKTVAQIKKAILVDNWMFSEDAKEYGLIDEIVTHALEE